MQHRGEGERRVRPAAARRVQGQAYAAASQAGIRQQAPHPNHAAHLLPKSAVLRLQRRGLHLGLRRRLLRRRQARRRVARREARGCRRLQLLRALGPLLHLGAVLGDGGLRVGDRMQGWFFRG